MLIIACHSCGAFAPLVLALVGNSGMPNFFKKLTSSFKMEEENDILENEVNENDSPEEDLTEAEENNAVESEDSDEQETGDMDTDEQSAEDHSNNNDEQEDEKIEMVDENEEGASMPDGSSSKDASLGEGERPYTIAQLASAQTTKKRVSTKVSKKKLPGVNLYSSTGSSDNESSMLEGQLAIDVYETDLEIVIKSTIAGAKLEDLDVGIEDNTVNIRGVRHNEEKIEREK